MVVSSPEPVVIYTPTPSPEPVCEDDDETASLSHAILTDNNAQSASGGNAGEANNNDDPDWGPRRRARSMPPHRRIGNVTPPRRQSPSGLRIPASVSVDPSGTVGAASASVASLPLPEFAGWAVNARQDMPFLGAGGVATLDRADVRRVVDVTSLATSAQVLPLSLYLRSVAGQYQVPPHLVSTRAFVRTANEARYIIAMNDFLRGKINRVPFSHPRHWVCDVQRQKIEARVAITREVCRMRLWYATSMRTGRVILADDYETLRADRSSQRGKGPDHRVALDDESFRVPLKAFAALPDCFRQTPLPPGIAVPEPLVLRYFPSCEDFVTGGAEIAEADVRNRHDRCVRFELGFMAALALYGDYYWTDRVVWAPSPVIDSLSYLRTRDVPPIQVLPHEGDHDPHPIRVGTLVERCERMLKCPPKAMYVRNDFPSGGRLFFAYEGRGGAFVDARVGEGGYAGKPAVNPDGYGTHRPAACRYVVSGDPPREGMAPPPRWRARNPFSIPSAALAGIRCVRRRTSSPSEEGQSRDVPSEPRRPSPVRRVVELSARVRVGSIVEQWPSLGPALGLLVESGNEQLSTIFAALASSATEPSSGDVTADARQQIEDLQRENSRLQGDVVALTRRLLDRGGP